MHRQLLEEERATAGSGCDRRALRFRQAAAGGQQPPALVGAERSEVHRRHAGRVRGPRRASGEQFGAGEAQQQHRRVDQLCVKVVHEVEQRRLRPMDVLEQQHQRAFMRDSAEEQPECPRG